MSQRSHVSSIRDQRMGLPQGCRIWRHEHAVIIAIVTTAFLAASASLAQCAVCSDTQIGLVAGVNVSRFRYDDELPPWDPGWRASFTGGTEVVVPFGNRLSVLTGPRYVRHTNRVKYDTGPGSLRQVGEFHATQDYLSLPVLLALRPLPSRRLFVSVGPEVGVLLAGRLIVDETLTIGASSDRRHSNENIKNKLKCANLSLDVGLGFEFPVGGHVAVTNVRYLSGLVGVAKKSAWYSNWTTEGVESFVGFRW